jgi:DNA mismatch endonuclease (patch repair protein)
MADTISREMRSKVMSAIRAKDTKPEVALRHALFGLGLRYRKNYGRHDIDIAFPGTMLAVFVDGCFWHCCPKHSHAPKSNMTYWNRKLNGNKARDLRVNAELTSEGWNVVRLWEHDINGNLDGCILRIQKRLKQRHS